MRGSARTAALAVLMLLAGWGLSAPAGAQYDPQDEWQGLPEGEGREEVFYNCVACHSMAIIMQQRLNRRVWNDVLDWMVAQMGMPEPEPEVRQTILDYLVEHFGEDAPR